MVANFVCQPGETLSSLATNNKLQFVELSVYVIFFSFYECDLMEIELPNIKT